MEYFKFNLSMNNMTDYYNSFQFLAEFMKELPKNIKSLVFDLSGNRIGSDDENMEWLG